MFNSSQHNQVNYNGQDPTSVHPTSATFDQPQSDLTLDIPKSEVDASTS